jgi:hypothetical protein
VDCCGHAADPLQLLITNVRPPAGAALFSVTVNVALLPPWTLVGLSDTVNDTLGCTVSVDVTAFPPWVAVSVTTVATLTEDVVTWNGALPLPALMVTLVGTDAAVLLLLLSATVMPPGGAGPFRATAALVVAPDVTDQALGTR